METVLTSETIAMMIMYVITLDNSIILIEAFGLKQDDMSDPRGQGLFGCRPQTTLSASEFFSFLA